MDRKGLFVGFLAGAFTVVALMILFTAGRTMPRAAAQGLARPEVPPVPAAERSSFERDDRTAPPTPAPVSPRIPAGEEFASVRPAAAAPAAAPRYQIVTWSQPGGVRDTGSQIAPSHGAYVLDVHSGEVWMVNEAQRPKMIQKVGKVGHE